MASTPQIFKRVTQKWTAELDRSVCDRFNNCNLTIFLNLYLKKIDPAGGSAKGMYPDHDGTNRQIIRWGTEWARWKQRFKNDVEKFWNAKIWLKGHDNFKRFDFDDRGGRYRPNYFCRFRLNFVTTPGLAHKAIEAVRLDSTEGFFRSNAGLWDDRDTAAIPQSHGSDKLTHVHEVGHLLGLGHVGAERLGTVGGVICQLHRLAGGSSNDSQCYGILDDEQRDVMGSGSTLREWHAKPWQEALGMFTGVPTPSKWAPILKRVYPRTLDEVTSGTWHTSKPRR